MSKKIIVPLIFTVIMLFLSICIIQCYVYFAFPMKYQNEILNFSYKYDTDPALISAIILAESSYNPESVSSAGAIGLMQIMPSTSKYVAQLYNIQLDNNSLTDPIKNIEIGVCYVSYLKSKYDDNYTLLSAYNAGEGTVKKWLKDSSLSFNQTNLITAGYTETDNYAKKVIKFYNVYKLKYKNYLF